LEVGLFYSSKLTSEKLGGVCRCIRRRWYMCKAAICRGVGRDAGGEREKADGDGAA
jgi:hypothetical protein